VLPTNSEWRGGRPRPPRQWHRSVGYKLKWIGILDKIRSCGKSCQGVNARFFTQVADSAGNISFETMLHLPS